jgi:SAM-dependent methyltransferase
VTAWFEDRASDWIRFARTEGHDSYWRYRDAFFDLLPPAPARVLEVGCGEGRIARDLADRGYAVTGLDIAPSLVAAAADADPRSDYVVGDASALPFADGSFDLLVSYNSLIDIDDMRAAVAEAGRVLRDGGHFCACVPHPFSEAGEFTGADADAPFVVEGSYLAESAYELVSERTEADSPSRVTGIRSRRIRGHSRTPGWRSRHSASRLLPVSASIVGRASRCSSSGARRSARAVRSSRAAAGSLLFLVVAPSVVAGLVPWL